MGFSWGVVDRSLGAPLNLLKCEQAAKVCAAEQGFPIQLPDGSTYLQLKTARAWTLRTLGKKLKHGDLDISHL